MQRYFIQRGKPTDSSVRFIEDENGGWVSIFEAKRAIDEAKLEVLAIVLEMIKRRNDD